jgi:AraC-like DNA-binding protein
MTQLPRIDSLAAHCPDAVSLHPVHRPAGPTVRFEVHDRWTVNWYTMPGRLIMDDSGLDWPFESGAMVLFGPGMHRQFHFQSAGIHTALHFRSDCPERPDTPRCWTAAELNREILTLREGIIDQDGQRRRASLWHLLWLLHDRAGPPLPAAHAALQRAESYIGRNLGSPLSVSEVVRVADISHNQLIRYFRKTHGCTITAYIQGQRVQLAAELLQSSDLAISEIAKEVGIPDRQHFNKTIRRHLGMSPSALRAENEQYLGSSRETQPPSSRRIKQDKRRPMRSLSARAG